LAASDFQAQSRPFSVNCLSHPAKLAQEAAVSYLILPSRRLPLAIDHGTQSWCNNDEHSICGRPKKWPFVPVTFYLFYLPSKNIIRVLFALTLRHQSYICPLKVSLVFYLP
jgi:hypothetical protein